MGEEEFVMSEKRIQKKAASIIMRQLFCLDYAMVRTLQLGSSIVCWVVLVNRQPACLPKIPVPA